MLYTHSSMPIPFAGCQAQLLVPSSTTSYGNSGSQTSISHDFLQTTGSHHSSELLSSPGSLAGCLVTHSQGVTQVKSVF